MIRDMVTEMNDVLWRAARDGGAEFIDIEDSLDGGQLCQGAKYVTGLHDIGTSNIRNENFMEAFHPNANGHLKIARSIYGQVPHFDGGASAVVRDAPSAAELTLAKLTRHIAMTADTLVEQASLSIKLDLYMLQPGSKASVVMYSDEVALGSFAVVDNGGLSVNIPLPDSIGPGRHALVLEGSSYSGEPITLYQFITVASATDGDADGDGIPDGIDRCPFIVSWYDEETGRDICINTDSVDSIGGLDPADNSDGGATEDASSSRDLARTGVPLPRWLLGTMLLVILSFVSAVIIKKEGYKNNVQRERSKKKQ